MCSVAMPGTCRRARTAKATDSIHIGPGESRERFSTAPAEGTYAVHDRGLSHYTGSADGSDAWVGGQRSEVRVIAGLGPQLKPNGWANEVAGPASSPNSRPCGARHLGDRSSNPCRKFLDGTVTVDYAHNPGTYLSNLWWVRSNNAPAIGSNQWRSTTFVVGEPDTFHIRVANQNHRARSCSRRSLSG